MVDLGKKLGASKIDEGNELKLLAPNGDELGIKLIVRSYNSKEVKKVARKRALISQKKTARGQKLSNEEVLTNEAEIFKSLIVGGDKFKINDKEIDPASLKLDEAKLIIEEYSFISDQVNDFATDDANFYTKLVGN